MLKQFLIIFGFLALGELTVYITGIKLPSCIIGMLLLTAALKLKWVKLESVNKISKFLLDNLGFFFVPPGVALMLYFDLIKAELLPIIAATVISTVVVLIVSGHTHQLMRKLLKHKSDKNGVPEK